MYRKITSKYIWFVSVAIAFSFPALLLLGQFQIDQPMLAEVSRIGSIKVMAVESDGSVAIGMTRVKVGTPQKKEINKYCRLIMEELRKYPKNVFELDKLGSIEIIICNEIILGKNDRIAISDYYSGKLYLGTIPDNWLKNYAKRSLHHEIFHLIDFRDDGNINTDESWERLNSPDFRYGKGGWSEDDPKVGMPDESVAGFLNAYSRSGVEEDKAEVFSHMMIETDIIEKRAQKDNILRLKMEKMKNIIKKFYGREWLQFR